MIILLHLESTQTQRTVMSSEGFEARERELKAILKELQGQISHQIPSNYGDDRRRTVQQMKQRLNQAESLVREMQLDVRVAPKATQHQLFNRMAQHKADIASLRHQITTNSDLREQLFSRQDEEEDPLEANENDQLLRNTATLQRASESLHRAQQVSAQTDEIADNVVLDLGEQRSKLLNTKDRVTGIESEMERTKSLLRTMACKAIENKLILICVVVVELIILAGLTYWKFLSK